MKDIKLIEKRYNKTESGKGWSQKNIAVVESFIDFETYKNYINSVSFFKNLGGIERLINKKYTKYGYLPTCLTSINPDNTTKIIREFVF